MRARKVFLYDDVPKEIFSENSEKLIKTCKCHEMFFTK